MSLRAEKVLVETIQETKGKVIFFWAHLDMDGGVAGRNKMLTFWSMCDILNGRYCRYVDVNISLDKTNCVCTSHGVILCVAVKISDSILCW